MAVDTTIKFDTVKKIAELPFRVLVYGTESQGEIVPAEYQAYEKILTQPRSFRGQALPAALERTRSSTAKKYPLKT